MAFDVLHAFSVAVFILFAAAARTWVVTTDFLFGNNRISHLVTLRAAHCLTLGILTGIFFFVSRVAGIWSASGHCAGSEGRNGSC